MTVLAIVALGALLALLVAHLRQGGRHAATLRRLAAAETAAHRWREAHELLSRQLVADVEAAIADAEAVTRQVLPMPADLDQVEATAWTEIVANLRRSTDA